MPKKNQSKTPITYIIKTCLHQLSCLSASSHKATKKKSEIKLKKGNKEGEGRREVKKNVNKAWKKIEKVQREGMGTKFTLTMKMGCSLVAHGNKEEIKLSIHHQTCYYHEQTPKSTK